MTRYNTPNLNIERPVPGSNEPHSTLMENAGWDKLDEGLGVRIFRWANTAAKNAQTGMVDGDEGYQANSQETYKRIAGAWKLWHAPWQVYAPTWTNLVVGNGSVSARWCMSAGVVNALIGLTFGTTTVVSGIFYPSTPVPMDINNVGSGWAFDAAPVATWNTAAFTPSSYIVIGNARATATTPWTWTTGDGFRLFLSGPPS